jgi:isorenieratene synthase
MHFARRFRDWFGRKVEARLGGYVHRVATPEPDRPERYEEAGPRVAVVGGGLAGLTAASTLAERGAQVVVFEKHPYLGGKIGGWREPHPSLTGGPDADLPVDHGFHAVFGHYHNVKALLRRLDVADRFEPIDEYLIVRPDGRRISFRDDALPPILNVLDLGRQGFWKLRQVFPPGGHLWKLERFLRYHPEDTFRADDERSFGWFMDKAEMPEEMVLLFASFARAFFSDPEKLSLAELVKSFHFYYLSHDHGLQFEYLRGGYEAAWLNPWRDRIEAHGGEVRLDAGVDRIERRGAAFLVDGERFDRVVLAADINGARAIVDRSPDLQRDAPALAESVHRLRSGQRYAVVRLYFDRQAEDPTLPPYLMTDRVELLDSITFLHRTDPELAAWAGDARGAYELHCYALPEGFPEDRVADAMTAELRGFLPGLAGATLLHRHVQLRDDFTAFHVGLAKHRPGIETSIEGLVLAGDWLRLPSPAMLMEAAVTSGLLAANALLAQDGLRRVAVDSVPLRGMFAFRPVPAEAASPRRVPPSREDAAPMELR